VSSDDSFRTSTPATAKGTKRYLSILAPAVVLALAVTYLLGIAWWPGGLASGRVLHGSGCPSRGETTVEGPLDRPAEDADSFPPGRDWSVIDRDPDTLPGSWLAGAYGAERWLKARLPWRVRFKVEWDSEGSLLAVYGGHDDICMIARVVATARG
jgi:hypothetical protein